MSRAFTKENDNQLPPALPERWASPGPNPVTPKGAKQIEDSIRDIEERLKSDNSDALARDLRYWQSRRASLEVIPVPRNPDWVCFGARVSIRRRSKLSDIQIVGEDEADVRAGLISWKAPLARAIEGAVPGETVQLEINDEEEPISILAVRGE